MIGSLTTDRPVFALNPVRAWGQLSNRQLIMQIVQPGLAGFMDGSVSLPWRHSSPWHSRRVIRIPRSWSV
jgi:hypothetical protein